MTTTTDEAAIAAVFRRLEQTWADADAAGFGELFTADCTYTTWFGTAYRGREEVVESHRVLWRRFLKGSRLVGEEVSVRFLTADVAVVNGNGDVYTGRRPRRLSKVQTYALVREAEGQWRIAAFQNTKRRRLFEAIAFRTEPLLIPAARKR